jgi:hypothetical protein
LVELFAQGLGGFLQAINFGLRERPITEPGSIWALLTTAGIGIKSPDVGFFHKGSHVLTRDFGLWTSDRGH